MNDDVLTPGKVYVEQLHGIDPRLLQRRRPFAVRLVHAPCEKVVKVLSQHYSTERNFADALALPLAVPQDDIERCYFAFQLAGSSWTQIVAPEPNIDSPNPQWDDWFEQWLSSELPAGVLVFTLSNRRQCDGIAYSLFECTNSMFDSLNEVEKFMVGCEGWIKGSGEFRFESTKKEFKISKSNHVLFFTNRGTHLNVESEVECRSHIDRVTSELGMFVVADVFQFDQAGEVRLMAPWKREDIHVAKLLRYATKEEQDRRWYGDGRTNENAKLEIAEGSEDFQRLQSILRGEISAAVPSWLDRLLGRRNPQQ